MTSISSFQNTKNSLRKWHSSYLLLPWVIQSASFAIQPGGICEGIQEGRQYSLEIKIAYAAGEKRNITP
jgi:hypothetical protein